MAREFDSVLGAIMKLLYYSVGSCALCGMLLQAYDGEIQSIDRGPEMYSIGVVDQNGREIEFETRTFQAWIGVDSKSDTTRIRIALIPPSHAVDGVISEVYAGVSVRVDIRGIAFRDGRLVVFDIVLPQNDAFAVALKRESLPLGLGGTGKRSVFIRMASLKWK